MDTHSVLKQKEIARMVENIKGSDGGDRKTGSLQGNFFNKIINLRECAKNF